MSNTILVTYASRGGSTAGVAEAIGKVLAESGSKVEVHPMQDVTDLTPYDAVVGDSTGCPKQWNSYRPISSNSRKSRLLHFWYV
jgi:menaquinone-dependent protoporphyrinogen oxidase